MVSEPQRSMAQLNGGSSSPSNTSSSSSNSDPLIFLTLHIATKLNQTNYLSWQSQIISVLHGYGLFKFVHLTSAPPSPTIINSGGQVEFNPTYMVWHRQDQVLLAWLRSSLSEIVLSQVVSCSTSTQLWDALQRSFSSSSRARLTELRRNLHNTSKGSSSCIEYINRIRAISDELSFIRHPITDEDLVTFILNGLGSDFNGFAIAINARSEPINSHDLFSLLLTHEQLVQSQLGISHSSIPSISATHSAAFYSNALNQFKKKGFGRGAFHNGRNRSMHNTRPSSQFGHEHQFSAPGILPLPNTRSRAGSASNPHRDAICHVCSKKGHIATRCWWRFYTRYGDLVPHPSQTRASQPPQPSFQAHVTQPTTQFLSNE